MKEPMIRVLKVAPGEQPEIVTLENELSALQRAVSIGTDYVGLIEIIQISEEVCLLCNEEGKLNGLKPNRRIGNGTDILCGIFYLTGQTKDGDLASLPESAMQVCMKRFAEPEHIEDWEVDKALVMRFFC
jgi:hypothetical protein